MSSIQLFRYLYGLHFILKCHFEIIITHFLHSIYCYWDCYFPLRPLYQHGLQPWGGLDGEWDQSMYCLIFFMGECYELNEKGFRCEWRQVQCGGRVNQALNPSQRQPQVKYQNLRAIIKQFNQNQQHSQDINLLGNHQSFQDR